MNKAFCLIAVSVIILLPPFLSGSILSPQKALPVYDQQKYDVTPEANHSFITKSGTSSYAHYSIHYFYRYKDAGYDRNRRQYEQARQNYLRYKRYYENIRMLYQYNRRLYEQCSRTYGQRYRESRARYEQARRTYEYYRERYLQALRSYDRIRRRRG